MIVLLERRHGALGMFSLQTVAPEPGEEDVAGVAHAPHVLVVLAPLEVRACLHALEVEEIRHVHAHRFLFRRGVAPDGESLFDLGVEQRLHHLGAEEQTALLVAHHRLAVRLQRAHVHGVHLLEQQALRAVAEQQREQLLAPHDAVLHLVGCASGQCSETEIPPNRANRVLLALVASVRTAVVALRLVREDGVALAQQACGAAFDKRNVREHAHAVDVLARLDVVQSVEDNVEGLEEEDVELGIHDIRVLRVNLHILSKLAHLLGQCAR